MDKPSYLELTTANELLVKMQTQVASGTHKAVADRAHAANRRATGKTCRAWFLLALLACVGLAALALTSHYFNVH